MANDPSGNTRGRKKQEKEPNEGSGMKRKAAMAAASMTLAVVLSTGAALAADIPGTNRGEVLRGTDHADTIYGYGGADLVYGFGGRDTVWGGNETVSGDKVLGGAAGDRLIGQMGDDALYGQGGSDRLDGQRGDDLLVGGLGEDTLNAGLGADEVDARDGRRDWIEVWDSGPGDVVYYDRGIDVLLTKPAEPAEAEVARQGVGAAEAEETGLELRAEEPPEGLFAHTGAVLVEHEGEELLVAEKRLEAHMRHGDEILDPTGRSED